MSSEQQRLIALAHQRFDYFVKTVFRSLYSGVEFKDEPYIQPFCYGLQKSGLTNGSRLLVNMPPRHLKSFCAAVCLPAWLLGRDPSLQIGVVTYGQELSNQHMLLFRRVLDLPLYRQVFPHVRLARGGDRQGRVSLETGGGYLPVTVQGSFTGMGVDVLILDDLMKSQDQHSQTTRERVAEFFSETAITRFNDQNTGRLIACMQRLHIDDLVYQLRDRGQFEELILPSIAPRDILFESYNDRNWLFKEGDLLSPARFPHDVLNELKASMGNSAYSAQFLQEPLPSASTVIEFDRLHFIDEILPQEKVRAVVQTIDTAVKDHEDCDYSVIASWGLDDNNNWHLIDLVRQRLDYPALKKTTLKLIRKFKPEHTFIEECHTGLALCRELRQMEHFGVVVQPPKGSKVERAATAADTLYSERIVFPKNIDWYPAFRSEIISFPDGRHDDIVDAITMFANWVRGRDPKEWYRRRVLGERPRVVKRRSSGRRR